MAANENHFDFFALPRELRDLILEDPSLFSAHQSTSDEVSTTFTTPSVDLFLLSHQFSFEYKEAYVKRLSLKIQDQGYAIDMDQIQIQPPARITERLHLDFTIACQKNCRSEDCGVPIEIAAHITTVRNIAAQLPRLKVMKISLFARPHINMASFQKVMSAGGASMAKSDQRIKALKVFSVGKADQEFQAAWKEGSQRETGRWEMDGNGGGRIVFLDGEGNAKVGKV